MKENDWQERIEEHTPTRLEINGGLVPVFAWYLVNILDSVTTNMIISQGGTELNAIYRLSANMGTVFLVKWFVAIGIMVFFYFRSATKVLWVFTIPAFLAVINNIGVLITR